MALIIFKYCLPILLGYTLFVGITGRYSLLPKPKPLAKRPTWFLGLWTGISVAVIAVLGLDLAYRMDLNELSALIAPGLWLFGAAMVPGIIGFLWYRSSIKRQIAAEQDNRLIDGIERADAEALDDTLAVPSLDATVQLENTVIMNEAAFANDAHFDWDAELNNELDETTLFDIEPAPSTEPLLLSTQEMEPGAIALVGMDPTLLPSPTVSDTELNQDATLALDIPESSQATSIDESVDAVALLDETVVESAVFDQTIAEPVAANELASELEAKMQTAESELENRSAELLQLRDELANETKTRKELETHLRITRKALSEMESESREFESSKANALMEMERELEEKIKRTAAAEARAEREANKRASLEEQMLHLREDALKASNDSRVSTEARAQALSTASKATTFARKAMQIRSRLETQLQDAHAELDNKQNTISSLIKALEKEKSRTQEDVASLAKQLVLHEKQLQARRTLEEVSRSVDNKLTTRLVKKVAKARG